MLTDSERFASSAWRIHALGSTGNAYDAVQTDESIAAGDTLLVPDGKVVGVAMTWPFAVTRESGKLHQLSQPRAGESSAEVDRALAVPAGSVAQARRLAGLLGFALDDGISVYEPDAGG